MQRRYKRVYILTRASQKERGGTATDEPTRQNGFLKNHLQMGMKRGMMEHSENSGQDHCHILPRVLWGGGEARKMNRRQE